MAGPDDGKGGALVPAGGTALANDDFEMRFLELAHKETAPLTVASVAYALKLPTTQVEARLEELAARDVIVRDLDDEGNLYFRLPGKGGAMARSGGGSPISAGASAGSLNGLLVNFVLPGVGSLMIQKPIEGVAQIAMLVVGIGLIVTLHILLGVPLVVASWIWGVVTGFRNLGSKK